MGNESERYTWVRPVVCCRASIEIKKKLESQHSYFPSAEKHSDPRLSFYSYSCSLAGSRIFLNGYHTIVSLFICRSELVTCIRMINEMWQTRLWIEEMEEQCLWQGQAVVLITLVVCTRQWACCGGKWEKLICVSCMILGCQGYHYRLKLWGNREILGNSSRNCQMSGNCWRKPQMRYIFLSLNLQEFI